MLEGVRRFEIQKVMWSSMKKHAEAGPGVEPGVNHSQLGLATLHLQRGERGVEEGAAHIDGKTVADDLAALKARTRDVERYGTKHVAHLDAQSARTVPTFDDLDAALDLVDRQMKKYMLLTRALDINEPVWQYDWKAIFREPWIPE